MLQLIWGNHVGQVNFLMLIGGVTTISGANLFLLDDHVTRDDITEGPLMTQTAA